MTPDAQVEFTLDGETLRVPTGTSLAAALTMRRPGCARTSVSGEARAPLCGMGICQECRLLVDGRRRLACQTLCQNGMAVDTGTRPGKH
ncbi:2Fe-2S iron-sulfur cluster-binding protein [Rhodoferax sp.]|uniref:2Fe-2S iron-sulfur cluster-binding protein n=1 Tax=Rhodoferax sp. TaxID=50421 RepID=UPI0025D55097|nr:2Fe-2S iron-sulfur cluster-binding protein [Rhodoferax sp.]